jgi:hypothetical protein
MVDGDSCVFYNETNKAFVEDGLTPINVTTVNLYNTTTKLKGNHSKVTCKS